MAMYVGGAELNVATALARWKQPVKYVTAMPDNYLSKEILDAVSTDHINVNDVLLTGNRIGSYYLPQGADLKNSGVIYDRAYSSFAGLKPGQLDWNNILEDVTWLHFSAISPALSVDAAAVCLEAVKAAKARNITISVDLNHRAKLWQYGKQPVEIMPELVQYCNVIMGNVWSAQTLLGIALGKDFHEGDGSKNSYLHHADVSAKHLMAGFPSCTVVANTFRFDEGEGIRYFAALNTKEKQVASGTYSTQHIVDRVGSGDCFMGGLIYGLSNKLSSQDVIEFAASAAFGKLQQLGDTTTSTVEDVQQIILSNEQKK